jgi:hypothetical protein
VVHILNENKKVMKWGGEGIFTAISVGFFFVLIGVLLATTPNLFGNFLDFVKSFDLVDVPNTDIILPGPVSPSSHIVLYQAVQLLSFALLAFQIVMLVLRFLAKSSWGKKAEVVGNLVFWLGAIFLIQNFLIETTQWFVFWSLLIIIIGISMISRAMVVAASRL